MLSNTQLDQELEALAKPSSSLSLKKLLFPQQLAFASDGARFKTAVCSRRAGKTVACAAALLDSAMRRPGSVSLYLTISRLNAKRIVWRTLLDLNREHGLQGEASESDLALRLPNGSTVYLSGVADRTELDKYRGLALGLVVVDEAQSLPAYLEELVDAVLAPALMDFHGTLALVGTPGPVPNGYFYQCSNSTEKAAWSRHSWTVFSNPHIRVKSGKTPEELLREELQRRGLDTADPLVQREWFGKWVYDPNSLVFRFDVERNTYSELPPNAAWEYVIGVDLGFDDADAIAVLAWHSASPNLHLVNEWVGAKQGITPLAERLKALETKYSPHAVVVDMGGLGKKIAEEIQMRTGLMLEAAEKERKLEHIELLNDALRLGQLKVPAGSRFAQDALLVEWDKSNPEKPKISDRFHSDVCDAVLYAFRKAYHWTHQPETPKKPAPGTEAWHALQAKRLLEQDQEMEEEALRETAERQREREDAEAERNWM